MVVTLVANIAVVYRYLLRSPLPWSDEVIRYVFVWLIFIGAAIAFHRNELVEISILTDIAKGKAAKALVFIRLALSILFVSVFLYETWQIFLTHLRTGELSVALEIPICLITLGMVVGGIIWLISALLKLRNELFPKNQKEVSQNHV